MFIFFICLMLMCLNVYSESRILKVIDAGVKEFGKEDMMLTFFVTVKHIGDKPRRVMVMMNECCEEVCDGDRDCDIIGLHGGDFGFIHPGKIRNFTLIYPTLYGYNRKGQCLVTILHRLPGYRQVVEMYHRIDFDTTIKEQDVDELEKVYNLKNLVPCETPDLDPLNHCNPVDCHVKYSGYRSFFNQKVKLCQKAKVCHTNLSKELPDIAYVPAINDCRNLETAFKEEDLSQILNEKFCPDSMVNVRCHHGVINPATGFCICDYGWKSEPYDPRQPIYSMCTIECGRQNSNEHLLVILGVFLALWLVSFVYFCERYNIIFKSRLEREFSYYFPNHDDRCSYNQQGSTYS